jgi:outer membrane protein OmpA-like peptidoglycan-associated protein
MRNLIRFALVPAALVALAGCDPTMEAGATIDRGTFGDATMNNTLIHSGELSYMVALTEKFAADVQNTVNFEFDSAVLDADAQDILRRQAHWIKQFPEIRFRVYGHTDLVGSNAYNKSLGQRRANAVVAYLASQGVSRARLEAVASYGETRPLVYTEGPERANRRTVTEVSGLVARRPAPLDGKYAELIYREYVASAIPPHPVGAPALNVSGE